jgi:hypothetical protein
MGKWKRALFAGVAGVLLAISSAWACDPHPNWVWLPDTTDSGLVSNIPTCRGEAFVEHPIKGGLRYAIHHRLEFSCASARTNDGRLVTVRVSSCYSDIMDPTFGVANQHKACVDYFGSERADGRLEGPDNLGFPLGYPYEHHFGTTLTITSPLNAVWVGGGWCAPTGARVAVCGQTDKRSVGTDHVWTIQ